MKLESYKGDVFVPAYGSISGVDVYLKLDVDRYIADLEATHLKQMQRLEHNLHTQFEISFESRVRETYKMIKEKLEHENK